jgi:predicted RNA binding protein YcfA (HicA-like mRNA interferase family)
MPKISQVKAREVVSVVLKLGFEFRDQSGSHAVYTHSDGRRTTVPIHPTDTIGIGLLTKIIKKDLRISKEEFIELLKK